MLRKVLIGSVIILLLVSIVILWTGDRSTVYLMPTPAVISTGEINPFDINTNKEKSNEVQILFATNRLPAIEIENQKYTIFPGNKLRLGVARMSIGREDKTWEKVLKLSTSAEVNNRPALRLEDIQELAQYPLKGSDADQPVNTDAMADMVNEALEVSFDKDITIYVHGANTSIYRACAQAAQYHHFTGQNSVVMVFLWPSAENLLAYGTDTRHALKSAPAFAKLIKLLAEHTQARNINILAYSAGAQIVSPALDIIGRNTLGKKRKEMRIGGVYYAASDIGVDTFVKHLQTYIDIPRSTTAAINRNDRVLAFAAWRNKISRLGKPNKDDLSPKNIQWLEDASNTTDLTVIKISADTVSGMRSGSHDFWYAHPWVSSDILIQFHFHMQPAERGLVEVVQNDNIRYWVFTPDYQERIIDIIKNKKN